MPPISPPVKAYPWQLHGIHFRTTYQRMPEGLDLLAWARERRAQLDTAASAVKPWGQGSGGWFASAMEGWAPADRLADLEREIAELDEGIREAEAIAADPSPQAELDL